MFECIDRGLGVDGRELGCCSLPRNAGAGEDGRDGLFGSSTLNLTMH